MLNWREQLTPLNISETEENGVRRGAAELSAAAYTQVREDRKRAATKLGAVIRWL